VSSIDHLKHSLYQSPGFVERTGAVISGLQTIHFFEQTVASIGSDSNVFVEHWLGCELASFLLQEEHYVFVNGDKKKTFASLQSGAVPTDTDSYNGSTCTADMYTFCRSDGTRVQLVTAAYAVMDVILQFHSSE
jgi:hypothetical protein